MRYILGLGSNMGNKKGFIRKGIEYLSTLGTIVSESSIYETSPVGMESGTENFFNSVVLIESEITPEEMIGLIKEFEKEIGRDIVNSHMKSRKIDIDIIFAGNEIIKTSTLEIPHPEMVNRKFVLLPLSEIAPDIIHPGNRKTISEILKHLESDEKINRLKTN